MPTVLSTLPMPVRVNSGGWPRLDLPVVVRPVHGLFSGEFDPDLFDVFDPSEQLQIDVTVSPELGDAAFPRSSREQIVGPFRLLVNGTLLPPDRRLSLTVIETLEGTTFNFALPRYGDGDTPFTEPLGDPRSWLGTPGGKGPVTIDAVYLTSAGEKRVRLVTNGYLDNCSGEVGTRTWNGVSVEGRYRNRLATIQFPPGHGQRRTTVARRILESAGITGLVSQGQGAPMYKELQAVDQEAFGLANAILEPDLLRVRADRNGDLRVEDISSLAFDSKRIDFILREEDVLSALGSLSDSTSGDVPTSITLTGTAQVIREECGQRTEIKVIDNYAPYAPWVANKYQNGAGDVVGRAGPPAQPPSTLRLVSRTALIRVIDCETVIHEAEYTMGWFNPEAARYQLASDGTIGAYSSIRFFSPLDSPVKDDFTPVYAWSQERFVLIAASVTDYTYGSDLYLSRRVSKSYGWKANHIPTKARGSNSIIWENEPYDLVWILAGGDAIVGSTPIQERFGVDFVDPIVTIAEDGTLQPFGSFHPGGPDLGFTGFGFQPLEVTTYEPSQEDGYLVREKTTSQRRTVIQGAGNFLYHSEGESNNSLEALRVVEVLDVAYAAEGEVHHSLVRTRIDEQGKKTVQTERGIEGFLPQAPRRNDIDPDPAIFDNAEDAANALPASRQESQPIKATVTAPGLLSVREPIEERGRSVEWAETAEELERLALHDLRVRSSILVTAPYPLNALIRPNMRGLLLLPSLGMVYDLHVEVAEHHEDNAASWGQLTGRHYVI